MNSVNDLAGIFGQVIESNRVAAYCNIASLTLLCYDYITTVSDEINVFWGSPWTIGRILYTLTRYCAFIDGSILNYCESHFLNRYLRKARV
ncbi:hypothetical protein M422DRAFT_269605 [Sphaerobolus stellatus SS14]|uniref:DUF6533 domain-containing protein n=1 Tax=Sphaerobolus stellatus (strain SS14) TaxID=990650 RepID=A0A0C9UUS8_SPHS4|nr:hypothetical protein M422DRAFT_269605 [Sphaerobolus stellatus SS14]